MLPIPLGATALLTLPAPFTAAVFPVVLMNLRFPASGLLPLFTNMTITLSFILPVSGLLISEKFALGPFLITIPASAVLSFLVAVPASAVLSFLVAVPAPAAFSFPVAVPAPAAFSFPVAVPAPAAFSFPVTVPAPAAIPIAPASSVGTSSAGTAVFLDLRPYVPDLELQHCGSKIQSITVFLLQL